jgi:hypothetical protein
MYQLKKKKEKRSKSDRGATQDAKLSQDRLEASKLALTFPHTIPASPGQM